MLYISWVNLGGRGRILINKSVEILKVYFCVNSCQAYSVSVDIETRSQITEF